MTDMVTWLGAMLGMDPKSLTRLLSILFYAHICTFITLIGSAMMFTRGRKLLRKYWRISKEGPFFRIAQWAFSKFVSLAVMVDKTLFNETLVSPPTNTRVKFTVIQTQSDRIILNWEAQQACRWIENMYELQVCRAPPAFHGFEVSLNRFAKI